MVKGLAKLELKGALLSILLLVPTGRAQQSQSEPAAIELQDVNTILMQSTFRIHGPATDGTGTAVGTVFILGRPLEAQPTKAAYVLVTSAHVLEDIGGHTATLLLREKNP